MIEIRVVCVHRRRHSLIRRGPESGITLVRTSRSAHPLHVQTGRDAHASTGRVLGKTIECQLAVGGAVVDGQHVSPIVVTAFTYSYASNTWG
jgi:hypothetical protein